MIELSNLKIYTPINSNGFICSIIAHFDDEDTTKSSIDVCEMKFNDRMFFSLELMETKEKAEENY